MTPPTRLMTGLILTAIAGFVDALAFIELGGYFASFMSGNTTQLGLALSDPEGKAAQYFGGHIFLMPFVLISLFFGGAFFASLMSAREVRWFSARVMLLVIGLLAGVLVLNRIDGAAQLPVIFLAAAMGAQNAVFKPHGAARLGTTFVTGTIFNAANDLANGLLGRVPPRRWLQHVYVWLSLVFGAALGALLYGRFALLSLLLPVLVLTAMLVVLLSREI
ncbi:YoaK family protein [Pseudochrobactrum sp. HB0163]|uniref:YoaK family protein n=1 Tax=Pseudochrobactrum sp. HB0163 TaxID=3450708 RepID=UPI003F6E2224